MSNAQTLTELLIRNFLSHRSYSSTLRALENESSTSKDANYQIERFIEEMLTSIDKTDIDRLSTLWNSWHAKIFNSLDSETVKIARQYEANTYRLLLVRCVQRNDIAKCNEFFQKMSSLTLNNPQWTEWYSFPYNPHAREMEPYKRYFDKQWNEIFIISVHNFLSICLPAVPSNQLVQIVDIVSRDQSEMSYNAVEFDEELMDDFAVIAQCSTPVKHVNSRTSLKSIFKNLAGSGKRQGD